ncbi:peptide chain release factor N(5)-glutamine methyltransferase [Tamlana sp. 2201CG12-4]|uniref:peptide chain release factor N(5)-glutamine methyltransferase n=1 Tax=Tamlana sp. 2201CG12-4 TaxID=3112582 RepID=UPI002DBB9AD8|nr:peptide chain release factor N(5)-glutamine methyltransferase [Tamlana sp. 2201CG12-4]MEC3907671.1 peptide chain release factor N(5)-glutamine methyltransferase [Tamlana sp. 2201CG12-4]
MRLKDIQNTFHKDLKTIYPIEEIDSFFYLLIASFYKVSRLQLAMNAEASVESPQLILNALEQLKQQKPIQYILGETAFFGLAFKVNKHVLIPRPETEELVEWILSSADPDKQINILDVGTGSGCIAIALAKHLPNAKVYALDVSKDALSVAKENASLHGVNVKFIEADVLNLDHIEHLKFDIIVSNPPYVREREKRFMASNVLENEPHLALFVKDDNALLFYEAIVKFAVTGLVEQGALYFEINEYLGKDMILLLKQNTFDKVELKQDIFKKDRMIKGIKLK